MPVARQDYWSRKFERTIARDKANQLALEQKGWTVLTIWECQLKDGRWVSDIERALNAAPKLSPTSKLRPQVNGSP
jgi:DNA mismatch endonuclease (patch repair protein)